MLQQKNFDLAYMKREGFGGRITIATSRANASERYVIKLQKRTQSLKEYIAQKLIAALGCYSIPCEWYKDSRGEVYGALQFMDGLKPVGLQHCQGLTAEQKQKMLFYLALSCILGNADGGEVYLLNTAGTPTAGDLADMDVCSLDYGEALCGKSIFAATFEDDVNGWLKIITEVSLDLMEKTEDFGKVEIEDGCLEAVRRLGCLDLEQLDDCLSDIERYFGKQQAEWYRQYFVDLKTACGAVERSHI